MVDDDEKPELFRPISAKVESTRVTWRDTNGSRAVDKVRADAARAGTRLRWHSTKTRESKGG